MPESNALPATSWYRLSTHTTTLLLQVLLWVLLTGFYFAWNSRPNYHFDGPIWPLALLQVSFAILLFNSLVYLIIPRWLLRGRTWLALAGGIALVFVFRLWMYAGAWLAESYLPLSADLRNELHSAYGSNLWRQLTTLPGFLNTFIDMLATTLFPLVVSFVTYALVIDRRRLALERDHMQLELSYLKTQINPQFLFNTLGSLHTMTRTRDDRAGDLVLHLADLMRYTLYETDTEHVPLSRELEFLDDYLALERLRSPDTTSITHAVHGTATTQQVVPLLLHPFLERLFAGLAAAPADSIQISSTVHIEPAAVALTLSRTTTTAPSHPYRTDAAVVAALRRLTLYYPNQHTVQLTEEGGQVDVHLRIRL
ncbi:histidine kinase [Hymenobacter tibetensis]|uniref:Histidine kinase n=1 Tax=Hymenobacter tibetensis TaxID=497967 RepID=A0ABY4D362_9BACT|nr:sensor histidine kinase [Hymenobacter tibetensis]UOG76960.1 histidine kinase [Hymenobacter tibetensis]